MRIDLLLNNQTAVAPCEAKSKSHLVESGYISALGSKHGSRGIVRAHLVVALHGGSCWEAKFEDATIDVGGCNQRHQAQTCKQNSQVCSLFHLKKDRKRRNAWVICLNWFGARVELSWLTFKDFKSTTLRIWGTRLTMFFTWVAFILSQNLIDLLIIFPLPLASLFKCPIFRPTPPSSIASNYTMFGYYYFYNKLNE